MSESDNAVGRRTPLLRWLLIPILIGVATFFVCRTYFPRKVEFEIALLLPANSDQSWMDFQQALRRVVRRRDDSRMAESDNFRSMRVQVVDRFVRFTWYPEVGRAAMERRVSELLRQARPHVIVGPSTSQLAIAVSNQLHAVIDEKDIEESEMPVLLLTVASVNSLTSDRAEGNYARNTVRYGSSNTTQAQRVVEKLMESTTLEDDKSGPNVETIALRHDVFSNELANCFREQLVRLEPVFLETIDIRPVLESTKELPEEDKAEIRSLVDRFASTPNRATVIVMPLETYAFRRVFRQINQSLQAKNDPQLMKLARQNISVVTGDWVGESDFLAGEEHIYQFDAIRPDEFFPRQTIFFVHVNLDRKSLNIDEGLIDLPPTSLQSVLLNMKLVDGLLDGVRGSALFDARDFAKRLHLAKSSDGHALAVLPQGSPTEELKIQWPRGAKK